jgi:hypothetical protein
MKLRIFSFLAALIVLSACKNEIDINAPYKDIPVVYGFLDQNQATQYIRIQKLYQNAANQTTDQGAKIADSLYFDSLVVTLLNITDGSTYTCVRIDTIPKDSGFFSSGRNTLYATDLPKNNLANEQYELKVFYPKGNLRFGSKTRLVKDPTVEPRKVVIRTDIPNHIFQMRYQTAPNSSLYDLDLRFFYREFNKANPSIFEDKFIDFNLKLNKPVSPNTPYIENIFSSVYFDYLKASLVNDPNTYRKAIRFEFRTIGGSKEFETLLSLNKPNTSIVEKNPTFSNITDANGNPFGIGIFSSRNFYNQILPNDVNTINFLNANLPGFQP